MTTVLGLFGALQCLILALAVLSLKGPERRPNRALGGVLLCLALAVFSISAEHGDLFGSSTVPLLLEYTAAFLFPPALWHYASTVLGRRPRLSIGLHLLPAAAWVGYLLAFSLGWTQHRWLPPIMATVTYSMAYTVAVAVRTWRSPSRVRGLVSHTLVLRAVVVLLFVLHGAQWVRYVYRDVVALEDVVPLTATAIACVLSLLAFRQSRLFAADEPPTAGDKYSSSSLTPEGAAALHKALLETMENEKPYLNESLNLADLAARLRVPRAHLSQVVNTHVASNFADFLSRYRVDEAERLLADPAWSHLTVEAIGYEVGFRSRSAFHSAYKRLRGETPASARKNLS